MSYKSLYLSRRLTGLCQMETNDARTARHMPKQDEMTENPPPGQDLRPAQPAFNVPTVVLLVIGVLVAIHVLFWALGESAQVWSLYALSFIPVRLGGGAPIPYPHGAQIWTFFSYALLHQDVYHLGSNSVWLLIFSTPVARRLGTWRYLLLLAGSAAAGAAAMLPLNYGQFLIIVGASASVSAALAAAIPVMFARGFRMGSSSTVDYEKLRVLSPLGLLRNPGALVFAAIFLAMTLLTGASMAMTGTAFLEERNIAWEAHLGGFIAGLILFYLLDKKRVP
jgi:membrane associated rhomboid family serine protease